MIKVEPMHNARRIHIYLGGGMSPRNHQQARILLSRNIMEKVVDRLDSHIKYYRRNFLRKESLHMPPFKVRYDCDLPEMSFKVNILSSTDYTIEHDGVVYPGVFDVMTKLPGCNIRLEKHSPGFDYHSGEIIYVDVADKESTVESLSDNLSIEMAGYSQSDMLFVIMKGENPFIVDEQLSALLDIYLSTGCQERRNALVRSREWVGQRLDTLSHDLSEIDRNVSSYKLLNRTINTKIETDIFLNDAMSVDDELFENDINIRHLESLLAFLGDTLNFWQVIPNNVGNPYISDQIIKYNDVLLGHQWKYRTLDNSNPVAISSRNNVAAMRNSIEYSISSYYESILIKQNELLSRKINSEDKIGGISTNVKNEVEMRRYMRVKRAVYRYLTKKYETIGIDMERISPDARIIEPPTGSVHYIWPRKKG